MGTLSKIYLRVGAGGSDGGEGCSTGLSSRLDRDDEWRLGTRESQLNLMGIMMSVSRFHVSTT